MHRTAIALEHTIGESFESGGVPPLRLNHHSHRGAKSGKRRERILLGENQIGAITRRNYAERIASFGPIDETAWRSRCGR